MDNTKNIKSNNDHRKQLSMQILRHLKYISNKFKLGSMGNFKTSYNVIVGNKMFL